MGHLLLLDTCVVILHGKILVAKQGFSSLFIHQEEGLHYDRKTTIAETSVEPVNTATNGPWKSIHIGGSNIIDLYFTLMLFYSTN